MWLPRYIRASPGSFWPQGNSWSPPWHRTDVIKQGNVGLSGGQALSRVYWRLDIRSCFQCRCCGCCLTGSRPVGPAWGPVRHPAPARKRGAAACCATEPAWPTCPRSSPVRPPPSTWRRTDSSSCRRGPLAPYRRSSRSLWATTTSRLSHQEPSRSVCGCGCSRALKKFWNLLYHVFERLPPPRHPIKDF